MMIKIQMKQKFIIPMVMGGVLTTAPHFSLAASAPTACQSAVNGQASSSEDLDLDALLREVGISEEAIATIQPPSTPDKASSENPKTEAPAQPVAETKPQGPKETFASVFHANVDIPERLSLNDPELERAAIRMGLVDPKNPDQKKNARAILEASKRDFVRTIIAAYEEMDPGAFEAEKAKIQHELRKHNVTANGPLLESTFFDASFGEIDRAKSVHEITGDYNQSLRDYIMQVTLASKKVKIRVPTMKRIMSKIPILGGKTEQELIDEAINAFFQDMVPIRTAIEATIGSVAQNEDKANQIVTELKKLRIALRELESEYETRITELTVIQNVIVDYIENDPVLSQDPKNSLRRYLSIEVIRDIQKTIARLQENLVTVKNGILSNYTNTEDLKDVMVDLHHTSQSLKTTLAITTMDTIVQNAIADFSNQNTQMKQLILSLQGQNADQALVNGRKSRDNAVKMQEYVLSRVQKINETIEVNQIERERFRRASVTESRKFIEKMKTHQAVITELVGHLEKADATSIDSAYDPQADQNYVRKLNLLIKVLQKDHSSISGDLLDKAQAAIDKGMGAMKIKRQTIWQAAEAELEKEKPN